MTLEAIKVLLVEDDPLFTTLVTTMLRNRGCTVHSEALAETALGALKSQTVDLLITDLRMEGLGGVGLIQMLMDAELLSRTRILVITGEAANSEDSTWVAAQGIPILHKPFTVKTLLAAVESIVDANAGKLQNPLKTKSQLG